MKNILITALIAILCSNVVTAQWYNRSCGVIDMSTCSDQEFECMWNKASKIAYGGAVTTIVGSSIIVAGGLIALVGGSEEAVWTGVFFGMAGLSIDIVGVFIWIVGAARKSKLEKLPNFQHLDLGSLHISPYLGINISLSF